MLEELIPYYPSFKENDSQLIFNGLAEIHNLEAKKGVEKRVKPGEYYKHQNIGARSMKMNDRELIMSDPGTGKTCSFVAIDELLKNSTNLFKTFYYVTPPNIEESNKHQIICKCTNQKYINDEGAGKSYKPEVLTSGKESFKANYNMVNYIDIHNIIKGKNVKQLRKEFNNCIFNLDEVTNIIVLDFITVSNKNDINSVIGWTEKCINDIKILKDIKNMDDPIIINSDIYYVQFWRLFHSIENSKVILASGTPINNRAGEFFLIMNLLLPLNKQMDVEEFANNVFRYNLFKYSPYLNGLISYVKASNVVARPNYIGTLMKRKYKVEYPLDETSSNPEIGIKEYNSQIILYKVELYGYQAKLLYDNKDTIIKQQINQTANQILCYVDRKYNTGAIANNDTDELFNLKIGGIEGKLARQHCCAMFTELVRIEFTVLAEARNQGKPGPGVCFNYLNLTDTAIGSLKTLFKAVGFEILENFDFLQRTTSSDYCSFGKITFTELRPAPRVVFLTGDKRYSDSVKSQILQIASSKDNIYGQYIQLVCGSSVMGVGVNISNSIRMTRPLPEWNHAKDRQSRDRVFREDAHDGIREIKADEIALKTGVRPNIYSFDINVDVYNMCAFCRYFYIPTSFASEFDLIEIQKNGLTNNNQPFQLTKTNQILCNGSMMLIDNFRLYHLIGFSKRNEANIIDGELVSQHVFVGEDFHTKVYNNKNIKIEKDLKYIFDNNMDIVISESGIVRVFNNNEDFRKLLVNHILLYHDNCYFNQDLQNGEYRDIASAILIKGNEYKLIKCSMLYISPSERQYAQLEEKSFASKRVLRYAKQFALDCITNEERNYNSKDKDNSIDCDYTDCKYTCSSKILVEKSKDSFIYEKGNKFWTNYEVLYSGFIINECKNRIIELLRINSKLNVNEIFNDLLPKVNREYFINMAIYEIISDKISIYDSFGTLCYISANNNSLYISRNFPKLIKNNKDNIGNYTNKLIAVENNPDYRLLHNIDDDLIKEIENINITNSQNYDMDMLSIIITKISQLKMYTKSVFIIIEKCFGRIAYNRTLNSNDIKNEFSIKPVDLFIAGELYPIYCFNFTDPSGISTFFHNHPQIKHGKNQAETKRLINASNPFRIFYINENKPAWRDATEIETVKLRDLASKDIMNRIYSLITKSITYYDNNGQPVVKTEIFKYYITFYNGNYRLTNIKTHQGKMFSSLNFNDIIPCVEFLKSSLLVTIPDNLNVTEAQYYYLQNNNYIIESINTAINQGNIEMTKGVLLKLFKKNNLIFYFSLKSITSYDEDD
jgi:hypothetical protein